MYNLEPNIITKELILSKVREETLMEHYLGVPVKKGLLKSPLRNDSNPTCAFYRNSKGDLIFKDFRGDFYGNFISVVMYKFNCSFYMALQIIANDFNIIKRPDLKINKQKIEYTNTEFKETKSAIIQCEIKDFNDSDIQFWSKYGISLNTLKKFNVFSCKNIFLNSNLFDTVINTNVYGYYGGIKNNIEQWRIYYPYKKKYKFISNWKSSQIQGAAQLPKEGGEYLVITKSLKDVMLLYEFNISAIAPISENLFVSDTQYKKLQSKFNKIILFYDNDYAGIVNMNKIRKYYPDLYTLFIPPKYKVKDISDFRKKYGHWKTEELILQTKLYIDGKKTIE